MQPAHRLLELEPLRWLVSIADGVTVTQTAKRFHTTQPAVSRGLQRLSSSYGTPLVEKSGRRLRLTFAGEIISAAAKGALRELDEAAHAVSEANDSFGGTVRLGFLNSLGPSLVPQLLTQFRDVRPNVRFELRQAGATRILEDLLDGSLDLVIGTAPSEVDANWEPLFDEDLLLMVGTSHRLARRHRIRYQDLAQEEWVVQPLGFGLRQRIEEIATAAGFVPRVAFEGHDMATLIALVGAGSGVGLCSSSLVLPATVRAIQLSPLQRRELGVITLKGHVAPASADAFAAFVRARGRTIATRARTSDSF
jgi:DNA-binding transcriptional LysR family regulator